MWGFFYAWTDALVSGHTGKFMFLLMWWHLWPSLVLLLWDIQWCQIKCSPGDPLVSEWGFSRSSLHIVLSCSILHATFLFNVSLLVFSKSATIRMLRRWSFSKVTLFFWNFPSVLAVVSRPGCSSSSTTSRPSENDLYHSKKRAINRTVCSATKSQR